MSCGPAMALQRGDQPVILFDGVCNLCNAAVGFVISRDPAGRFRFASLQSEAGQRLLAEHGLSGAPLSSVVLIEQGRAHTRSAAGIRIARRLASPWLRALAYLGAALPPALRDYVYDLVARHRYRWFGRTDACRMPTPERLSSSRGGG